MFLLGVGALKLGLLLWSTENSVRSSIGGGVRWEWGGRAEYEGSITDCGEGVSQSGAPGVEAGLSLAAGLSEVTSAQVHVEPVHVHTPAPPFIPP